ncbi:hypothetical protein WJ61_25165 [Burkholderia ubonensis]|nr:hypothetical protein WJ61_25165 [Burkholderia ubonensis]
MQITPELRYIWLTRVYLFASPSSCKRKRSKNPGNFLSRKPKCRQHDIDERPRRSRQQTMRCIRKWIPFDTEAHHGNRFVRVMQLQMPTVSKLSKIANLPECQRTLGQFRFEVNRTYSSCRSVQNQCAPAGLRSKRACSHVSAEFSMPFQQSL